tara:strand:+ start:151 stop:1107 length:957 start_codon:yes stop_codon:yes gene_type:complete
MKIKFAIVSDNTNQPSYYCQNNKFFEINDDRDVTHEDLAYSGFWNYPALFDGYFINLNQMRRKTDTYPDEKFELIFAAIERDVKYLDKLKILYPDAVIVGLYKENWNQDNNIRNYVIEHTDGFVVPYGSFDYYEMYNLNRPKRPYVVHHPVNHKLHQKDFKTKKVDKIFNYQNNWGAGRGGNKNIEILEKSGIEIKHKTSGRMPWGGLQPFTEDWVECKYMLSTDESLPGGVQSTLCAVHGTIMIGSNSDGQRNLFPELVGTEVEDLTSKIEKLKSSPSYRNKIREYAFNKFLEKYSFTAVKKQIIDLYKDIKENIDE